MITVNTRMADILDYNINILSIFKRLGIKLGFQERTIAEVCRQYQVDTPFFLEITKFFLAKEQFTADSLSEFKVSTIVTYLQKTHDYYINYTFPLISSLIEKLLASNFERKDLTLVRKFFISYHNEFVKHIEKEEKDVFPYILELEKAFLQKNSSPDIIKLIKKQSIVLYAKDHDNVDEKLNDLRNILIKYLPPLPNEDTVHSILFELYDLERDVKEHTIIEDKILVPRVSDIEQAILNNFKESIKA
jgi:regulator of cell morphogenesis and NO signaling